VKLQEQEFFAARDPKIANAPNAAARKKLIEKLAASENDADRALHQEFRDELRKADGWSHLLRDSGRYPLTGRGDINTYAVFAENGRTIVRERGRTGVIVPTGIATEQTTAAFFREIVSHRRLASIFDFITNPQIWQEIGHGKARFSLLTVTGREADIDQPAFATLLNHPSELSLPDSRIRMLASDLLLANPNTGTCPMFRTQRDADITLDIYRRVPVMWRDDPEENPWGLLFMTMFHMTNDSGIFHTWEDLKNADWMLKGNVFIRREERMLPLYEAKLVDLFDHRLACYSKRPEGSQDTELPRLDPGEKSDPTRAPIPRYWVSMKNVEDRLAGRWDLGWLLGWRGITSSKNERTMICSVIPLAAVGNSFPLVLPTQDANLLCACWSTFIFDYVVRQKIAGSNFNFFVLKQLPVLYPNTFSSSAPWSGADALDTWIRTRMLELSYTTYDMTEFAQDVGDDGAPFRWNEERRALMRAELDAAFFHLYGIERDDVDYIMETFPIVKRKDIERYGSFRTKELILQVYDAMAESERRNRPYETILDPPPGHGPRHPARGGEG
jgi:hypothetical protein